MKTSEVINEFFELLGAKDAAGVAELFAENIDWYVPGSDKLPWTGQRSKKHDVPEYLHTMWSAFEPGKSIVKVHTIMIDGEHAAVFSTFSHTAASTGRPFETPTAMHFTIRDGRIVTMHLYEDTAAVGQAFLD